MKKYHTIQNPVAKNVFCMILANAKLKERIDSLEKQMEKVFKKID